MFRGSNATQEKLIVDKNYQTRDSIVPRKTITLWSLWSCVVVGVQCSQCFMFHVQGQLVSHYLQCTIAPFAPFKPRYIPNRTRLLTRICSTEQMRVGKYAWHSKYPFCVNWTSNVTSVYMQFFARQLLFAFANLRTFWWNYAPHSLNFRENRKISSWLYVSARYFP